MKKIISILVSVIMIFTALPVFADGETTVIPASVDIYEALDNFSADELATTYTKNAPYTTDNGFKAPTGTSLNAILLEDDEVGGYVRMTPTSATSVNQNGGAALYDSNIKIGTDHMNFTASVTFRQNDDKNLRWYFHKANGDIVKIYPLRWYAGTGGKLHAPIVASGGSGYVDNHKLIFELGKWYTVTYTMDLNKKTIKVVVDGGKFDNDTWYATMLDAQVNSIISNAPLAGVGVGYLDGADSSDSVDIANMSISTSGSTAYDEKLTFENGAFVDSDSVAWTNGNWKAAAHTTIVRDNYSDLYHSNAAKLTPPNSGTPADFWIENNIPANEQIGSDGTLGIEFSYFEHLFAQTRVYIKGTDSAGNEKTLWVLSYGGYDWDYSFCGNDGSTLYMPKDGENWRKVKISLDLKNDTAKMNTWDENQPKNRQPVETNDTNTTALADFETITYVGFKIYPKSYGDNRYMCLDDMRIYEVAPLRYTGSNPVNGGANAVSVTANPSLIFNMPVENYTGTMTLKDSDGNAVAGTVGLNAQRNGVAYYPTVDLKEEETYTLDFEGTVTDTFGQTLAVDKTITFTTEPVLTLVNFEFSKEKVTAGDLGATIEVKSEDKLSKNVYAAIAIYNKVTNELVSIDTDSINAVTKTFELTANVPDDGNAYYAKAFVWNTEAVAAPYFAAETLGLND